MKRAYTLLLFVIVAAAAGYVLYSSMPVLPEKALARAFTRLGDARHVGGVLTFGALLPQAGSKDPVPLAVHGVIQTDLPTKDTKTAAIDAVLTLIGAGGDGKDAYLEVRTLADGTAYLKFDGLPAAATAALPGSADGTWYSASPHLLGELLQTGGQKTAVLADTSDATSAAAYGRLLAGLASGAFFVTDGSSFLENVDGAPAYRFAMQLKPEAAPQVAEDIAVMLLGRDLTAGERAAADASLTPANAQFIVWVDRKTQEFRKAEVDLAASAPGGERRSIILDEISFTTPSGAVAPPSSTSLTGAPAPAAPAAGAKAAKVPKAK